MAIISILYNPEITAEFDIDVLIYKLQNVIDMLVIHNIIDQFLSLISFSKEMHNIRYLFANLSILDILSQPNHNLNLIQLQLELG